MNLERGYSELVHAMLHANLDDFFAGLRWPGWRAVVQALELDRGIRVHPPLWTKESREREPSRKDVPLGELVGLGFDMARQLGG